MPTRRASILGGFAGLLASAASAAPARTSRSLDLSLIHADGRITPTRVVLPPAAASHRPWPVVLFSHGANSSNRLYERLFQPWAERGFCIIAPNHLDAGGPPPAITALPPGGLWPTRVADLTLPLDQAQTIDAAVRTLGGRLDWRQVCAAGHSFGGAIAQALAGASLIDPVSGGAVARPDGRVKAVAVFSPPGPRPGFVPPEAWSTVAVPALLQTGDADVLPGFIDDWRQHKAGFDAAPGRRRWLLIGSGVDHYFGGGICRLKTGAAADAQSAALDETARISGDFLAATLKGDDASLARLRGNRYGPAVTLAELRA